MPFFPAIRSIMEEEIRRKFGGRKPTLLALAHQLKMSPSTVQMYLDGRRNPRDNKVQALAGFFYPRDANARASFIKRLGEAGRDVASSAGLRGQLASGEKPLRICYLKHPPISGSEQFLDRVFRQFVSLAGIPTVAYPSGRDLSDLLEMQNILQAGKADLVFGHFSTVDRALRFRFVAQTPIRISLGAVCLKKYAGRIESLRSILWRGKGKEPGLDMRPIVTPREVGWLHCIRRLGYDERDMMPVSRLDEKEFAAALQEAERRRSSAVPVIVVDELTSLRVLQEMKGDAIPVLPLTTERSLRDCTARREMPIYSVGIPAAPGNEDLVRFFSEALPLFMRNEEERIASDYLSLYRDLENVVAAIPRDVPVEFLDTLPPQESGDAHLGDRKDVSEARRQSIMRRWARTALRLNSTQVDAYESDLPWKPILSRCREMLRREQGNTGLEQIKDYVDALGKIHKWYRLHRIVGELEEEFDVKLELDRYYPSGLGAPVPGVSYKIGSLLVGRPIPVKPRIDRALEEHRKPLRMILLERTSFAQPNPNVQKRLIRDVQKRLNEFPAGPAVYFIAFVEQEPAGLIGLTPAPPERIEAACEISDIFVRTIWRGYGLARKLVEKAIDFARKESYRNLLVDTLTAPHEAMLLYRMLDFGSGPEVEGKIYLQKTLQAE